MDRFARDTAQDGGEVVGTQLGAPRATGHPAGVARRGRAVEGGGRPGQRRRRSGRAGVVGGKQIAERRRGEGVGCADDVASAAGRVGGLQPRGDELARVTRIDVVEERDRRQRRIAQPLEDRVPLLRGGTAPLLRRHDVARTEGGEARVGHGAGEGGDRLFDADLRERVGVGGRDGRGLVERQPRGRPVRRSVAQHGGAGGDQHARRAGLDRGLDDIECHRGVDGEDLALGGAEGHGDGRQMHQRIGAELPQRRARRRLVPEVDHDPLHPADEVAIDGAHVVPDRAQHVHDASAQAPRCPCHCDAHGFSSGSRTGMRNRFLI